MRAFHAKPLSIPNLTPLVGVLMAVTAGVAFASTGERAEVLSLKPHPMQACKCKTPFVIYVDARGRVATQRLVWRSTGELGAVVADLKQNRITAGAVMIEAHPDASHADVMRVYKAVRAAGENYVQFAQAADWTLGSSD